MKTTIRSEEICDGVINNLQISEDEDLDLSLIAVLLFTPDMRIPTEHHHIDLKAEQAARLHNWLGRYLEKQKRGKKQFYKCLKCGGDNAEKQPDTQGWDGYCSSCGMVAQEQVGEPTYQGY